MVQKAVVVVGVASDGRVAILCVLSLVLSLRLGVCVFACLGNIEDETSLHECRSKEIMEGGG